MSVPWVEKYRPTKVSEIVGNKEAVKTFLDWISNWGSGGSPRKAALLAGPPGVGKTSLVHAYALENGYDLVEINASDRRGAEQIQLVVGESSLQSTLTGSRKRIILVDEVDGASGSEYSGGVGALSKIIDKTSIPIVLVANDPWDPRLATLREKSVTIKFSKLSRAEIMNRLRYIASREGIDVSDDVIKQIADRAQGDLRSAVNDLQALAGGGKKITPELLSVMSLRDRQKSVFDALAEAFGASTVASARLVTMNLDVDLDTFITWLVDNVPNQIKNAQALAEAYTWISEADLHLSRAQKEQKWSLMRYGLTILNAGVGLTKRKYGEKGERFAFPSKIRFMQESRDRRETMRAILRKISAKTHMSNRKAASEMLPYLRVILSADSRMISKYFELDEHELTFLVGDRSEVTEQRPVKASPARRRSRSSRGS